MSLWKKLACEKPLALSSSQESIGKNRGLELLVAMILMMTMGESWYACVICTLLTRAIRPNKTQKLADEGDDTEEEETPYVCSYDHFS